MCLHSIEKENVESGSILLPCVDLSLCVPIPCKYMGLGVTLLLAKP